eukprot:118951-Amphidinium_carterae.1
MEVYTFLDRSVFIRESHGSVEKLCASKSHEPNAVQKSQLSLREWTRLKSGNALPNGCEKKGFALTCMLVSSLKHCCCYISCTHFEAGAPR